MCFKAFDIVACVKPIQQSVPSVVPSRGVLSSLWAVQDCSDVKWQFWGPKERKKKKKGLVWSCHVSCANYADMLRTRLPEWERVQAAQTSISTRK